MATEPNTSGGIAEVGRVDLERELTLAMYEAELARQVEESLITGELIHDEDDDDQR